MGGRVSTLVLSGGEAGGGERAVKSLSPQSWAEKIGRKKGTGWGGGGRRNSNQLMFTKGSLCARYVTALCAKD